MLKKKCAFIFLFSFWNDFGCYTDIYNRGTDPEFTQS